MGQYYKPVNLDKKEYVYSHDIKSYGKDYRGKRYLTSEFLKLMEHSWRLNRLVNAIAGLIAEGGAWHGDRLVWAGDYAEGEPGLTEEVENYQTAEEKAAGVPPTYTTRPVNLYRMMDAKKDPAMKIIPKVPRRYYRFFLNLDTNEYVDVMKCPEEYPETPGCNIHPLPLLTCEGNGQGGGDFPNDEHPMIGKWARQRIVASYDRPKVGTEIFPNFTMRDEPVFRDPKKKSKSKGTASQMRPDVLIMIPKEVPAEVPKEETK